MSISTIISVYEPADPAVPTSVTPVVYAEPPLCVPFSVVENLNGCEAFDESDKSNLYVNPGCRSFVWRKKWRLNWERVKYCSKKCSKLS